MISKEKEAINLRRSEEGRGEIKRKEHGGGWRKDREWGCDVITLQQKLKKMLSFASLSLLRAPSPLMTAVIVQRYRNY